MNSIIDLIYDNDIFRTTDIRNLGAEYKSAVDRLCEAEKRLLERSPECAEIFTEYQNAQVEMTSLVEHFEFVKGMRAGAQLMLELLKPIQ